MGSSLFWLEFADEESKCIPHDLPRFHGKRTTGQCMIERYLSATMLYVSEFENLLYYYKQPLIISIVTSLQRCSQIFIESLLREYLINAYIVNLLISKTQGPL